MEIDQLRKLIAAATPGPWMASGCLIETESRDNGYVDIAEVYQDKAEGDWRANAKLIAAAVNALPILLDGLEAANRVAAAARRSLMQTQANVRDGLVPTMYYSAHQDLKNALNEYYGEPGDAK